jgi:hypothetical protein
MFVAIRAVLMDAFTRFFAAFDIKFLTLEVG